VAHLLTGQVPFLSPDQPCQSTEGNSNHESGQASSFVHPPPVKGCGFLYIDCCVLSVNIVFTFTALKLFFTSCR